MRYSVEILNHLSNYANMKILCWLLMFFLPVSVLANERIILKGVYQGSDIYVQNPFSGQGVSFCVFEVRVNGEITSDEVNSSAFVIDLAVMGVSIGEDIEVVISHKKGCEPRVLNPEVLNPRSTYEIETISVSDNGILKWTTIGESGELPFYVEQFKWNKWVKAGEVMGAGTPDANEYEFQLEPHSGMNSVRVRQTDYRGESRTSPIVEFKGPDTPVSFAEEKTRDVVTFSGKTSYEIFDQYGNLVKKGYGKTIDVEDLEKGEYYLNYDRSFGETFKKR